MNLELTSEQKSYKAKIERFAREVVAPRASSIDKTGEYPADVMHAAAAHGLLGVTIPRAWGGAGLDYVSYA
ncbi:MAG TPA: acyl-CoA dehydrogenase family protein, partial [Vicinamibacterales bacterium]